MRRSGGELGPCILLGSSLADQLLLVRLEFGNAGLKGLDFLADIGEITRHRLEELSGIG